MKEKQQLEATDSIRIRGARVHNLKNISLDVPHNQFVVITGLSGSGKSTLAFDTIFAEGQRRYVESLSAYARQFLGRIDKPDVDEISGIAPAIAIQQNVNTRNPRSTVGTSTEIYDYLKLLFARAGHTFSPVTGREVKCYQSGDVVDYLVRNHNGEKIYIASPILFSSVSELIERLTTVLGEGIQRLYVDSHVVQIEELMTALNGGKEPDEVLAIVDRVVVHDDEESLSRMNDSTARAFACFNDTCRIVFVRPEGDRVEEFSARFEADGIQFEQPTEHLFSFNNPLGACPRCDGYGKVVGIDEDLVVPDKNKSIYEDAIACWRGETMRQWKQRLVESAYKFDFPIHKPYYQLSREEKLLLWRGNEHFAGLDEFFKYLESERYKIQYRVMLSRFTGKTLCPECDGSRLRREALYVQIGGKNIAELVSMSVEELARFFRDLTLEESESKSVSRVLLEVCNRLQYLLDVGLGYLTLDRLSSTLSGGESQRINLATSLGSNLTGSLYILDEPSIGLHPRDTDRLIAVLKQLRDLGNTVIVVEHEEEIIRAADRIIDIGPLAGSAGGEVVFNGTLAELPQAKNSLTADYLLAHRTVAPKRSPRGWSNFVEFHGVRENNLKGIDVKIPLGVMTCITGVSGSGKSSLVEGVIYPAIRRILYETGIKPGSYESLSGDVQMLSTIEMIDQNPLGRSQRSNPVTYTKAYDDIRRLFTEQPYARHNGFNTSHFSFNRPGGRCEECQGDGVIKVSMQFMADIELKCEACGGKRFRDDVLEVKYRDKSIYDVLEMSVDEAVEFFAQDGDNSTNRRIVERLSTLSAVGLGYIKLGQSTSTLSGGEIQRVKLASFLQKENSERPGMFIFDEPTTGLHFHDIQKLLHALDALIERGHTVLIVEHNMELIRSCDWVIDLGPEAGDKGGEIVFQGKVEDLVSCKQSYTGKYLSLRDKI